MSSFTTSINISGQPFPILSGNSMLSNLLPTYASLLSTCPIHISLASLNISPNLPTSAVVMYLDLAQGSGAARINIATTDKDFDRSWRIKVTQITCDATSKAPPNCLQYYTEYSGIVSSFNYQNTDGVHQLGGQRYTICIRAREGFCGIKYIADENEFSLSDDGTEATADAPKSGDTDCTLDFLVIPSMDKDGKVTLKDRFCGNGFDDLITYSKPFEIRVVTEDDEPTTDINNRGFSMRYTQIPC
ncbi:hypothetical protein SK128_007746 [Halocaridina rubra]|uniref:CUB domain-containing protein n=1 Tax=Halocaridina rubra TaxID=373956 RepID=A0AAN8WH48_HALRR